MNRRALIYTVVGLLVLLFAVLLILYISYIESQVTIAKQQPIMALPAVDLTQLSLSVTTLQESLALMEPYYDPLEFDTITQTLYPTEFLHALVAAEQARRTLIAAPTLTTVQVYRHSMSEALSSYQSALTRHQAQLERNPNLTTYFLDGKVGTEHLAKEFATLHNAVNNLHSRHQERHYCISTKLQRGCEALQPYTVTTPTTPASSPDLQPELLQFVTDTWSRSITMNTTTLTRPSCALGEPTAHYAWRYGTSRTNNLPMVKATIIDDVHFYDLHNVPDTPYYEYQRSQGLRFDYQPTNPYMCIDFAHDIAEIVLTDYFTQTLTTEPLFQRYSNESLTTLRALETALVSSGSQDNTTLAAYMQTIESYIQSTDHEMIRNTLSPRDFDRLLEYRLIYATQSVALIPTLGLIDDMMTTNLTILETTKFSLDFLFLARSYFTATLLFGNQTLVSTPPQLYRDDSQAQLQSFNLTAYSSIADTYSLTDLKTLMNY